MIKKEIMNFYKDFFSYNPNITFNLEKDVINDDGTFCKKILEFV